MNGSMRHLPSNIEAEQGLLGAILMNPNVLPALPETFKPEHLFEPIHQDIYLQAKKLFDAGKSVNTVTVKAGLPAEIKIGDMSLSKYLARLATEAVNLVNAPDFASAITFYAMRRSLISLGENLTGLGYHCGDEVDLMASYTDIRDGFESIIQGLDQPDDQTLADAAVRSIESTAQAFGGKGLIGVDLGFSPITQMIGPAMPGQLIVIGGGTKQGKSSLIEQIAMGAAINGHPIWVYSGEMKSEELAQRALSRIADVQAWRQNQGKVNEREIEKLEVARHNARNWQERVFIRDKPMTLDQIDRAVEGFSRRHKRGLVIIDHIGLVERDKATWRMTEQEFGPVVTRSAKILANKAGVPVVAAAQLKKNTFVADDRAITAKTLKAVLTRRPRYTDLIGACEKDANHVIMPFRPEPILQDLEPDRDSAEYGVWEDLMQRVKGRAELRLVLSRHQQWPQDRKVGWNGSKTQFEPEVSDAQGSMI